MTAPITEAQVEEQEQAAQALEDALAAAALEDIDGGLAELLIALTILWIAMHGDTDTVDLDTIDDFRDQAQQLVRALPPGMEYGELYELVLPAYVLGTEHAHEALDLDERVPLEPQLSLEIRGELYRLVERIQAAYDEAATVLAAAEGYDDLVLASAVAGKAHGTTDRTVRWVTNRAIADGTTDVADHVGASRVWVTERDGCLHCQAYAGRVAGPGQSFPPGLTFGDRPLHHNPVPNPPYHHHCRCRAQAWLGSTPGSDGGVTWPETLQREAERQVLLGRSAHASNPARIRAAERLLRSATFRTPRTVQERARSAVRRGRFDGS
jgi:hypothetical protein